MSSSKIKENNLFKALGYFIEAMRLFIPSEITNRFGREWEEVYRAALSERQQIDWDNNRKTSSSADQLIDYGNLGIFVLNRKDILEPIFGRSVNKLPTMLFDIAEARNMAAHYNSWDDDLAQSAYLNMIRIAKKLEMNELVVNLRALKNEDEVPTGTEPPIDGDTPRNRSEIKKSEAIDIVNSADRNNSLTHSNTIFSNINKSAPCWWLNIPPEKFNASLNLLLAEKDELIWIHLPKGTCIPPQDFFETRKDNGKIDLRIGIEGNTYLKDTLGDRDFNFMPFEKERFMIRI